MVKYMLQYGKNALVYKNHRFFGQTPKSSSKVLLKLEKQFIVPSVVVLGTQI